MMLVQLVEVLVIFSPFFCKLNHTKMLNFIVQDPATVAGC